jgi:hypothetical protein
MNRVAFSVLVLAWDDSSCVDARGTEKSMGPIG